MFPLKFETVWPRLSSSDASIVIAKQKVLTAFKGRAYKYVYTINHHIYINFIQLIGKNYIAYIDVQF